MEGVGGVKPLNPMSPEAAKLQQQVGFRCFLFPDTILFQRWFSADLLYCRFQCPLPRFKQWLDGGKLVSLVLNQSRWIDRISLWWQRNHLKVMFYVCLKPAICPFQTSSELSHVGIALQIVVTLGFFAKKILDARISTWGLPYTHIS